MNNSVNFAGFVDFCSRSADKIEPHGYVHKPASMDETAGEPVAGTMHCDEVSSD